MRKFSSAMAFSDPGRPGRRTATLLVLALLLATPAWSAAQPPEAQPVLAHIERLKGAVLVDEDDPARPVVGINLNCSDNVDDALLARLRAFPRLRVLRLNFTAVTDAGLAHLQGLTELRELTLDHTQVSDAGLVHLKGLTNLRVLSLDQTRVRGDGLVHLTELTRLETLSLSQPPLGSRALEALRSLRKHGPPTAEVRAAIAEITRLGGTVVTDYPAPGWPVVEVDLAHAQVDDAFLARLQVFPGLRVLRLDATGVTDAGLAHLRELTELRTLTLDHTRVTDLGLLHLTGLSRLETLSLAHTAVGGQGVIALQALRKGGPPAPEVRQAVAEIRKLGGDVVVDYGTPGWPVVEVNLAHSAGTNDAALALVRRFTGLRVLCLDSTAVTDAGLAHLQGLTELRVLALDGTRVTDAGLVHLTGLSRLEKLWLSHTRVGDGNLKALQALKNLQILDLTETPATPRGVEELLSAFPETSILRQEFGQAAGYLYLGELARGEHVLKASLEASPRDDRLRFGLGVLQFVRGVERLGQALHRYGCRSDHTNLPFLRLPVPRNPEPAPITYAAFRGFLDDFRRDLAAAEATLAGVTDDQVKLRLRLARFRLDLRGAGKPNDRLLDVLQRVLGPQVRFPADNPELLVCFDRGDVAWLRAYCHLLMAMLDAYLAFDTEAVFNLTAAEVFDGAKPAVPGAEWQRQQGLADAGKALKVKEPGRLGDFRKHLLKVAELNRETWKYIRAETDDDHEWLPNARQRGVLGLPVRDEMIDAWLDAVAELEGLLNGNRVLAFPFWDVGAENKGLNLKTLLENPPAEFRMADPRTWLPARYRDGKRRADFGKIMRVIQVFESPSAVAYALWFN